MRKTILVCGLLAVTTSGCWTAVDIQNADFAAGVVGQLPEGWTGEEGAAAVFEYFDADGHSGTTCLQYHAQQEQEQLFVEQSVKLATETEYVLSAWLKSDGATMPTVEVRQPGEKAALDR